MDSPKYTFTERQHKHPLQNDVFLSELRTSHSLENIQSVHFVLHRLVHENEEDADEAFAVYLNEKPNILLLEGIGLNDKFALRCNAFVSGDNNDAPTFHPFLLPFLKKIRTWHLEHSDDPLPIFVHSDTKNSAWDYDDDLAQMYAYQDWAQEMQRAKVPYAEAFRKFLHSTRTFSKINAKREHLIMSRIVSEITPTDAKSLSKVRDLKILAPFGAAHGNMRRIAAGMGMSTKSIARNFVIDPRTNIMMKIESGLSPSQQNLEDAFVGSLIESVFMTLRRSGKIQHIPTRRLWKHAWKLLRHIRNTGTSSEDFYNTLLQSPEKIDEIIQAYSAGLKM